MSGPTPEVYATGKDARFTDHLERVSNSSDEKAQYGAETSDGNVVRDWTPAEEKKIV